jgi:hypothetical protein
VIGGSCGPVSASAAALAGAGIPAALIPGTIGAVQGSLFDRWWQQYRRCET